MLARRLLSTVCCLLLLCTSMPAYTNTDGGLIEALPETNAEELLSDDNLLIVELVLGKYRLASDVFIYHTPELTLVPLQPLFDALEFPILVDPVAEKANGWFLSESNRFDFNHAQRSVQLGEESVELDEQAVVIGDGIDLYVDIETFNRWFPLQTLLNMGRLRLEFESEQPLPLERQLEREKRRKSQQLDNAGAELPRLADHYRWLGSPAIDVNLSTFAEREPSAGNNADHLDSSYSVQGSMDMLGMQGRFSTLKSSRDADSVKRFTLSKKPSHPDERLAAKLSAVELGDIYGQSDSLVFKGGDGLGAGVSWGGQQRSSDFGKRIVEGNATPGWEVELYRNGGLIDFQLVDDQGRYRFEDVPVEFGENVFDIRLYGPQGQEDSRRELVRVGDNALPRGELHAQASFVDVDDSVFDNDKNTDSGREHREQQSALNLQLGVSDTVSLKAGYARHDHPTVNSESEEYHIGGINFSLAGAALSFEHVEQQDSGYAQLLSLQTRVGDASISYLQKKYSDFSSDRNQQGSIEDDYELRLTGYSSLVKNLPIAYQLSGNLEKNMLGQKSYSVEPRISFSAAGGRITLENTLNDSDAGDRIITGRLRYLRSAGYKVNLRASADYNVKPDAEFNRLSASAVWRPTESIRSQLSLVGDLTGNASNQLDLSVAYLFKRFSLSGNLALRERGQSSFGLNLEFSLDKVPERRWQLHNEPIAAHGRVAARVFLDNNVNGQFDEGDEPLEGVSFTGRQKWEEQPTGADGRTYLYGMRSDSLSTLKMDMASLEDPYLQADFELQQLVSHAGAIREIDIPVVMTGEAEGMLLLDNNGRHKALAGIPMYLTSERSGQRYTITSEFDGYFIFDKLLAGNYQLTLEPEATAKLGVSHPDPIQVTINPDAGVTYIGEIVLTRGESQAAVDAEEPQTSSAELPTSRVSPPPDSATTEAVEAGENRVVSEHSPTEKQPQTVKDTLGLPATAAPAEDQPLLRELAASAANESPAAGTAQESSTVRRESPTTQPEAAPSAPEAGGPPAVDNAPAQTAAVPTPAKPAARAEPAEPPPAPQPGAGRYLLPALGSFILVMLLIGAWGWRRQRKS